MDLNPERVDTSALMCDRFRPAVLPVEFVVPNGLKDESCSPVIGFTCLWAQSADCAASGVR